jgi:REP element-mobilizing transposase RayT
MKLKYRNREFLCGGYYVDTAGKNVNKRIYKKSIERR